MDGTNFTYNMLTMSIKATGQGTYQYIICAENNTNFDPHSIGGLNIWNARGYIAFESKSAISQTANGGYIWNGDTNQFIIANSSIILSCKNLNYCGYINYTCLEQYNFTTINSSSIINTIPIKNGQSVALPLTNTNYTSLGFTLCKSNKIQGFILIPIPANRTLISIKMNSNNFSFYNSYFNDWTFSGSIINNILNRGFVWNN